MRSCLEARSFRREVILLTETRLNPVYQLFLNLLQVGYEHVVLLSLEDRCARSQETWPRLACAWSSQAFVSTTKYLLDRVAFMARGARLGYNLLMLDSDVIVFRDLYPHLKGPLLGNATIATMRDGNGWVNCGVVYVQNARPDGPAAYMLAEVVDRLERWGENPGFYSSRGLSSGCWDQQMYSDTLMSTLAGRPISYGCWWRGEPPSRREAWDAAHMELFGVRPDNVTRSLEARHYLTSERLTWPPEMLEDAPEYPNRGAAEVAWGRMRVPNSKGVWPEGLGGAFYPPERGAGSRLWREVLKEDVLPLWPDPEDPAQEAAAASIRELFAYLPIYLVETWSLGGAYGYWNAALRPRGPASQPPVALAHFVHVPGGATNKLTVKLASGNWDWDVAHTAHPNRGVFFASHRAAPVPDALAFSPELERREWASEAEFAAAVLALVRLAAEMGRAVAYPAPRCNVSWLGGLGNNKLPLAVPQAFHIPYAPRDEGFAGLRCLWGGYLQYGCQAVRSYFAGGLLAPEYDHLLQLLQPNHTAAAAASATKLERLGFAPAVVAAAAAANNTGPLGRRSSGEGAAVSSGVGDEADVVTVPLELMVPPAEAAGGAWNVTELAARLMERYGGVGSGLLLHLHDNTSSPAASSGTAAGSGGNGLAGGGGGISSGGQRPRVLVLPEVPRLAEHPLGDRYALLRDQLSNGPDRHSLSCEWIRTGRPYRRRTAVRRRAAWRRRGLLEREEAGGPGETWRAGL